MKPQILCVGSGALGSYYSGILQRGGAETTLLCRSDYEVVKARGISVKSCDGDFFYKPDHVIKSVSELSYEPDFIFVFLKVLPEIDLVSIIKEAVAKKTTIVLVQNGIDIETPIQTAFPNNEIIGGLAFICCQRIDSGLIDHQDYGHIKIGTFPTGITEKGKIVQKLFEKGGIDCILTDDVIAARWEKLVWNAPFNPLSAILGGVDTKFMLEDEDCYELCEMVMKEVVKLSEANGHAVSEELVEKNLFYTKNMVPYKTSMCHDYENRRHLEVDAILGNAVRIADQLNVSVPHLKTIYTLLKQVDRKIRG